MNSRFIINSIILFLLISISSCKKPQYNLTVNVSPTEGGSVSPQSGTYEEGTSVTLTSSPSTGYEFKQWSGGVSGTSSSVSVIMDSDKTITGVFVKKTYPLNITIEGEGSVTEEIVTLKSYDHGTTVKLTPVPTEGWEFVEWGGDISGSVIPVQVTLSNTKNITCKFIKKTYPLNITIEGEGSVTEEIVTLKSNIYDHGTTVKLTPVPTGGWEFVEWSGDLTGSENPVQVTITDTKNITCKFVKKTYPLNITIEGEGTVTEEIVTLKSYDHGTTVKLTPVPVEGWEFVEWSGDITGSDNPIPVTITDSTDITCKFIKKTYPLNITIEGEGTVTEEVVTLKSYDHGTTVKLTPVPTEGWEFVEWSGDLTGSENPVVVTITESKIITCIFTNDTDGDGVLNKDDLCSNTPSGVTVNSNGCQITYVPDVNFEKYLIGQGWDDVLDGYVITDNIKDVNSLSCSLLDIKEFTGIEDFINLIYLHINRNPIKSIDISKNIKLREVKFEFTNLSSLDVSKNTELNKLLIYENEISSLDVSKNIKLDFLYCDINQLSSLDVSKNINLRYLSFRSNNLREIDVSNNINLITLNCSDNKLTNLNVDNNTKLVSLNCDVNQLSSLDVKDNTLLEVLRCNNNQITSLDVSTHQNLRHLYCYNNQIPNLDVSKSINLTYFWCENNQLTSLDVSNNINLVFLKCFENDLTEIDVSKNPELTVLFCNNNQISNLDVSMNPKLIELECQENNLTSLDVSKNLNFNYFNLSCYSNPLTCIQVNQTQLDNNPSYWNIDSDDSYSLDCSGK